MGTVALLEFDRKLGPTILQSSGELDIPKKAVHWATQVLPDESYTNISIEGYWVGAVKFVLRDPSIKERGGRRSFSFLLISNDTIQEFEKTADKILKWVHAKVDGLPRQVERLEGLLHQLMEQEPVKPVEPTEIASKVSPLISNTKPPNHRPYEEIVVKSVPNQPKFSINPLSKSVFEEHMLPFCSIVVCQWIDSTEQVEVRFQIGRPLSKQHQRILTLFSLGCEKEQENLDLSFGNFYIHRINENTALIGQPNTTNGSEKAHEFFDAFGEVLKDFPEQITFFLNLYQQKQSIYLTYSNDHPSHFEPKINHCEKSYLNGIKRLIPLMDGSSPIIKIAETLYPDYSIFEILYMLVILNHLGAVQIQVK
ncbi:MAG: hypothetical protein ACE5R6_01220 [Candidatus Heimdallarchaeota archaeon]